MCMADHFEPGHGDPGLDVERARMDTWVEQLPRLAARFADADGRPPRHTFFFPAEQYRREHLDRLASPPLDGHVTMRGYVSDTERRTLFRDAAMLGLPSFEEGFGLPVLEAMACGVPVVISNRGSLPEVAGDAARPIDPDDVEALAAEMARLLDPAAAAEAGERGLQRAAQFTWKACAESAMQAYASAIARRRERGA